MRIPRVYVSRLSGNTIPSPDASEVHHLVDVLRRRPGDEVEVFDGFGARCRAIIREAGVGRVRLEPVEWLPAVEGVLPVDLLVAAIRPSRMEWLVEKASELGARSLQPVVTRRGQARPGVGRLERWRRIAVAAAKQCGRGVPLEIRELTRIDDLLACPDLSRRGVSKRKKSIVLEKQIPYDLCYTKSHASAGIQCGSLPSHLTLQPMGLVRGTLTGLPAKCSSRALSRSLTVILEASRGLSTPLPV